MHDPNLLGPSDLEFYKIQPKPAVMIDRATPQELLRAVNYAHDNLRKQEKINKSLNAQLDKERLERMRIEGKLDLEKFKVWLVTAALVAAWELFKALVLHI